MPTVDELLNASNEVTTCTINPDTREIIVPEKYKILGVFSDDKVTKIPFTCPRVVGNNVDLTEYNLYINYQNASGASNAYLIDDLVVSGENITFSWLLSRYVTFSQGVVKYNFCAKKLDGDTISNEWNTTIATGLVIQGLEATREIIEENPDIIESLISKAHSHENKSVLDKFSETDGKPTYDGIAIGSGGTGGASTAEDVSYTNTQLPTVENVKTALDELVPKSHTHGNKDMLDKLSDSNGKLQYNGSDVGLKGDKGDTGATGADGKNGVNGITPTIGANGNWYIGNTDTGKPSRGEKGDTGASGAPGKDGTNGSPGADGITPTIGTNGNWYLGTSDTGKPSRGEKGDKGDPGSDANVTKDNVVAALGYTPEAVSAQVSTGSNITLADNTEYRLTNVTTLSLSYPTSKFECWMRLTFAASGNITVTLPTDTEYLGATPNFKNGETWELSFKDKILAAKKVGDDDKDAGGENGVTPHIGENGNWYIGNTDTGKPSRGLKGDKGDTGAKGADGKTPVKGTDYWTAADKQEIINDVIAALPDGTEVSY